jgi:copper chaperone CopZ
MSTTATYSVSGLTCEHCVHAVSSEIGELPGVSEVSVELIVGGDSAVTVISEQPLADQDIAAAVDEAGDYRLVGAA